MCEKTAYSYHTFILPFFLESKGDVQKLFGAYLNSNPHWMNSDVTLDTKTGEPKLPELMKGKEILFYKEYQYFYPFVRDALYGLDKDIIENYEYVADGKPAQGKYRIERMSKGKAEKYQLDITAVRLKVYNTGVALFILECENREHTSLEAVKAINDYGRRISVPYIPNSKDEDLSCADKLSIQINGIGKIFETDYSVYKTYNQSPEKLVFQEIGSFIKELMGYDSEFFFVNGRATNKNEIYIYPLMDDRMFVSCYVIDKSLTENYIGHQEKDGKDYYNYQLNEEVGKSLYEFIYVDPEEACTCQDKHMREELIERALYKRWFDYGSLYGMTEYSLVAVTDSSELFLRENFLNIYGQIYCLLIAQRASVLKFQREVTQISKGIEQKGRNLKKEKITRIMGLEERLCAFDVQMCFTEVSSQQQAIEVYTFLKKVFLIEEGREAINKQLETLYTISSTSLSYDINKVMIIFTWLACILSVGALVISSLQIDVTQNGIQDWLKVNGIIDSMTLSPLAFMTGLMLCTLMVCVLVIGVILFRYRRRK